MEDKPQAAERLLILDCSTVDMPRYGSDAENQAYEAAVDRSLARIVAFFAKEEPPA